MEERKKKKNIDIELLRLPHYYFRKKNEICHMQILRFVDIKNKYKIFESYLFEYNSIGKWRFRESVINLRNLRL